MTDRLVVLGCGYVGLELVRQVRDAYDVVGVRRSDAGVDAVEAAGGTGVQADVTDPDALERVPDADAVVFAASAGGRGVEAARATYVEGQRTAIEAFCGREHPPDRYVYTSSTGVYGDHDGGWVDEQTAFDPDSEREELLIEAERLALDRTAALGVDGTVARFGGLYGPDRYRLERYITGPVTEGYLNVVHRDDAAGAVAHLLAAGAARGEVVNVVDDEPVEKWTFADWLAEQCGVEPPPKQTVADRLESDDLSPSARRRIRANKRVANDKLRGLGYELRYPTFREGYRDAIERCVTENGG
jgi:nucleoside-diphosphate-sugar epimerase